MALSRNSAADPSGGGLEPRLRLSRMMREGRSWSGRERNCFFLNLRNGAFADVSALSGFDFPDDGRALVTADWDGDGDLDLWVSNRNAPRLRLLLGRSPPDHGFLRLRLAGNGTTTNRDAVGARVEVIAAEGGPRSVRTVRAGDGFLSQSSLALHFGLGRAETIDRVLVHWPNRERTVEEFRGLEPNRTYRLVEGSGRAEPLPARRAPVLVPSPQEARPDSRAARVPLVVPLPVPLAAELPRDRHGNALRFAAGKPLLVHFWASWCSPCVRELAELTRRADELRGAGLEIAAFSVDHLTAGDEKGAGPQRLLERLAFPFFHAESSAELLRLFQSLHDHHLPVQTPLPLPTSFLVGGDGHLRVIYKGPVEIDVLLADAALASRPPADHATRRRGAAAFPGEIVEEPAVHEALRREETRLRFLYAVEMASAGFAKTAIAAYEKVLEAVPDFPEALSNLGLLEVARGNLARAAELYERALRARPDFAACWYNYAVLEERRGDSAAAMRRYAKAVELRSDYREALAALGIAHARLGHKREAEGCFRREIAIAPRFADAHNRLGLVLLETGRDAEARDCFEEAIRLAPLTADPHNNLGLTLARSGDADGALRSYQEAVRLEPTFAEAQNNLGAASLARGDLAGARAAFQAALAVRPELRSAREGLARVETLLREEEGR